MNYASIIVTFNRKKNLCGAINSLLNQSKTPSYIFIIDNHSTDGTQDLIYNLYHNNNTIKYFRLNNNEGGAGGFYKGLEIFMQKKYDDIDWVSLSDDDVVYESDYFENIFKTSKINPNIKAFSGTVYDKNRDIETIHRRVIRNWDFIISKNIPLYEYEKNFYYDLSTFVGLVINRKLIKEIGLPTKEYFIWYDDSEYSLRIRKLSKIINVSNSKIIHKDNGYSINHIWKPNWKEYYGIRNYIQIIKKYGKFLPLSYIYILGLFIRKMVGNTIKSERKGYRIYMYKLILNGFFDGISNRLGKNDHYIPNKNN